MAAYRQCAERCLVFILCISGMRCGNLQSNDTEDVHMTVEGNQYNLQMIPAAVEGLVVNHIAKVAINTKPLQEVGEADGGVAATSSTDQHELRLRVESARDDILTVEEPTQFPINLHSNGSDNDTVFISIKGLFLGRTHLRFYVSNSHHTGGYLTEVGDRAPVIGNTPANTTGANSAYTQTVVDIPTHMNSAHGLEDGGWRQLGIRYHVSVIREKRAVDTVFLAVILIIVLLANVGMGCKIDVEVVKEVLRRPIAPLIGLLCQYLLMPGIAFSLIKILHMEVGQALGMFAVGCSPGGGASNMYAYLLEGDVSLSVTMTLISTVAALGMIPLWLFTVGQLILDEQASGIRIPFSNIGYTLLGILIPVFIGVLIQRYRPVWSKKIRATLRPVFIFFLIFIFTFGVYTNLYVFQLFSPGMIIAGCTLPYAGFFLGGLAAFICRQSWTRVKTIAIETGIQNTGIAYLLITFSLPQPEADLSLVSPIVVATFTPIPLMIGIAVVEIRKRCFKKKELSVPTATTEELLVTQSSHQVASPDETPPQNGINANAELDKLRSGEC